jgi:membrane protease YdiL (CAAX protease family)
MCTAIKPVSWECEPTLHRPSQDSDLSEKKPEPDTALIQNTLLCASAVSFLFGPIAGLTCAVANVVFAQLQSQDRWFSSLDDKVVSQVKGIWEDHNFFKIQLIMGIVLKCLGAGINQVAIQYIKDSVGSPLKMLMVFTRVCVIAPLVEETIFRGFLQEKIQNLQVYVFGEEESNTRLHRAIRIIAQAIIFGICHYHPSQGVSNRTIMIQTGLVGLYLGDIKEDQKNIWGSSFFHAYFNAAVLTRVVLFGV